VRAITTIKNYFKMAGYKEKLNPEFFNVNKWRGYAKHYKDIEAGVVKDDYTSHGQSHFGFCIDTAERE
jgi:hypothetical protein